METISLFWDVQILSLLWMTAIPNIQCSFSKNDYSDSLTYSELQDMEVDCAPFDTCESVGYIFRENEYNCDCDSSCAEFNTCCIDSEFRTSKPFNKYKNTMKCLPVYGNDRYNVFMVDSCKKRNAEVNRLCKSSGEDRNDPLLTIPVTSTITGITYKNYFCLVCNENFVDQHIKFWNLLVKVYSEELIAYEYRSSLPDLKYDSAERTWRIFEPKTRRHFLPVSVRAKIPEELYPLLRFCDIKLITECDKKWRDDNVRKKCKAYMAKVTAYRNGTYVWYKNPHCAICNYQITSRLLCNVPREIEIFATTMPKVSDTAFLQLFVLDDEGRRCGRRMVYDSFAKICRCNSRISVKKNGKCVRRT